MNTYTSITHEIAVVQSAERNGNITPCKQMHVSCTGCRLSSHTQTCLKQSPHHCVTTCVATSEIKQPMNRFWSYPISSSSSALLLQHKYTSTSNIVCRSSSSSSHALRWTWSLIGQQSYWQVQARRVILLLTRYVMMAAMPTQEANRIPTATATPVKSPPGLVEPVAGKAENGLKRICQSWWIDHASSAADSSGRGHQCKGEISSVILVKD